MSKSIIKYEFVLVELVLIVVQFLEFVMYVIQLQLLIDEFLHF